MQTKIEIIEQDNTLRVTGPYSEENNTRWRSLGGKFSGGAWILPDNDTSRETVAELFGTKSEEVDVLVPKSKTSGYQILQIGGYVLAQRRDRDSRVQMPDGVSLAAGEFSSSGGSRKSPAVCAASDVVFRLRCRKSFADAHGLEPAAPTSKPTIDI